MEAALQTQGQALALELHAFLRDADRAAKGEFLSSARTRLESIAGAASDFLRAAEAMASSANEVLTARVFAVSAAIDIDASTDDEGLRAELESLVGKLRQGYEELAAALRESQVEVPQLRPANFKRNVFHVGSSLFSAALIFSLREFPWALIAIASAFAVLAWSVETLRRTRPGLNDRMMALFKHVSHPHEAHQVNSATWYATALLLLAATMNPLIMLVGVLVLGFADPAAAIVGRRLGRLKLVNGRTLEGTTTFVVVGGLTAFAALTLLAPYMPTVQAPRSAYAAIAFGGAFLGGLAELFSRRIDDNMSIPLASALGAWLVMLVAG